MTHRNHPPTASTASTTATHRTYHRTGTQPHTGSFKKPAPVVVLTPAQEAEKRVKGCLTGLRLGDEAEIRNAADMLLRDAPLIPHFIVGSIMQCARTVPAMAPIYAALTARLTAVNSEFGDKLFKGVHSAISQALESRRVTDLRLLLQYVASLTAAGYIEAADLSALLLQLLGCIAYEELEWRRADVLVYTALSTLPWLGESTRNNDSFELAEIMAKIGSYMADNRPSDPVGIRQVFAVKKNEASQEDVLRNLYEAVRSAHADDSWGTDWLLAPLRPFSNEGKVYTVQLEQRFSQGQGAFVRLRPDVSLFEESSLKNRKGGRVSALDRLVAKEWVADVLEQFAELPAEAARQLLQLPQPFDASTLMLEVLLTHVLWLPRPPHAPACYGAVLANLFSMRDSVPSLLGKAMHRVWLRLDTMDLQARDQLAVWFAKHLSNFDFEWPWKTWLSVVDDNESSSRYVFVKEVLERCKRLSYWDRISDSVPEDLQALLPDVPEPAYRYAAPEDNEMADSEESQTQKLATAAEELLLLLREKSSSEHIIKWLQDNAANAGEQGELRLLVPTLLQAGFMSFSHQAALLERYHAVLAAFTKDLGAQLVLAHFVGEFWQHSSQHVVVVFDKLCAQHLLEIPVILHWLFAKPDVLHQ